MKYCQIPNHGKTKNQHNQVDTLWEAFMICLMDDFSHRAARLMGLLNWPQMQDVAKKSIDLRYPAGGFEPF